MALGHSASISPLDYSLLVRDECSSFEWAEIHGAKEIGSCCSFIVIIISISISIIATTTTTPILW